MTKVEELRRRLDTAIDTSSKTGTYGDALNALHCVEPLISAARSEGVAEGAEREAAKIIHCSDCKCGKPMPNPAQCDLKARRCTVWHCTVSADGFCYAGDRASVLAPTKETGK